MLQVIRVWKISKSSKVTDFKVELCKIKIAISHFWTSPFPKSVYFVIWDILFQKWLPRANHYAHETRSEILSRTPVSIFRDLSPRLQNLRKTSEYSFLAWMSMFSWVIGVIWDLAYYFVIVIFYYSSTSVIFSYRHILLFLNHPHIFYRYMLLI